MINIEIFDYFLLVFILLIFSQPLHGGRKGCQFCGHSNFWVVTLNGERLDKNAVAKGNL